MKTKMSRKYTSPARDLRASETRERILAAVAGWMQAATHGEFTFDDIAQRAGVERRTVFRHFETKEILLESFWLWINEHGIPSTQPRTLDELIDGPKVVFPKFDEAEGVIRGSLHTRAGRLMRMGAVSVRREAFHNALLEVTQGATKEDQRRLEAVAHALYSAATWEVMRDYAGVTGDQAGDAAAWALSILINTVRKGPGSASANKSSATAE